MLKQNKPSYFDVHEFENLVDHYLENRKLAKANQACEMAIEQHQFTEIHRPAEEVENDGRSKEEWR